MPSWMPLEKWMFVASVFPVWFQWSSSGLSVCSNNTHYHWIATGWPLGDSISQCGSSAVQWYPMYWQHLVWCSAGHVSSQHATPYVYNWRLFKLQWCHLNCNHKYTKKIMVLISKACTKWCWSTHTFEEQNWYASQTSKIQVKAEFTETCLLALWCPATLSVQTGTNATRLSYIVWVCMGCSSTSSGVF